MESLPVLSFLIAGQLRRDYLITNNNKYFLDIPGGNLLYAAAGLGVWERDAGLIGRVGTDYPEEWLEKATRFGFDRRGVRVLLDSLDLRSFTAYADPDIRLVDNPVIQFARRGLPFPKSLLGFTNSPSQLDSKTQPTTTTIRLKDVPQDYLDATAAHLCPLDFLSHTLLPSSLRQGHISTITLDPAPGYMNPVFWDEIPKILNGINAFITNEEKLSNLFQGRSSDVWEMAETLGNTGCEIILIKRGARGQFLYSQANHTRWMIPAYPAHCNNPTGAGDAFCGGFLAGYRKTYDPIEACLYGSISASIVIEGNGPFFALDALPGLANARLEAFRNVPRKV